jgi:hypothetical protein
MAKILITGGAGFIGSHVARALVARGDEVRLFDALIDQVHGRASATLMCREDFTHPRCLAFPPYAYSRRLPAAFRSSQRLGRIAKAFSRLAKIILSRAMRLSVRRISHGCEMIVTCAIAWRPMASRPSGRDIPAHIVRLS